MPWHRSFYRSSECPWIPRRSLKWQAIMFEVWISWCQCRYVVKYSRVWWYLIINDWDLGHFLNINAGYECWLPTVKLSPRYFLLSPLFFLLIANAELGQTHILNTPEGQCSRQNICTTFIPCGFHNYHVVWKWLFFFSPLVT